MGVGRGCPDIVEQREGAVDDEIGRNDPRDVIGLDAAGFIVELNREIIAARQISLGLVGIRDAVLLYCEVVDRGLVAHTLCARTTTGQILTPIIVRCVSIVTNYHGET